MGSISGLWDLDKSRISITKLLLLGFLVVGLLNAFLHDPHIGYDADDYAAYIETLASGRLPGIEDTDEFFTPPVPFSVPAILSWILNISPEIILKLAQIINVFLALGTALALVRISDRISSGDPRARNLSLAFLLTLPVFYKSHAFVRAEPYLLFFIILYIEQLVKLAGKRIDPFIFSIKSGILFGAVLLARQWGILILPGVFVYAFLLLVTQKERRMSILLGFLLSGLIAFVVSGWFYITLLNRYGSVTAFNRKPAESFSLKNKPASFYIGLAGNELFTDPVRDSFDNQMIPILYAETWGDYWQFFVVFGEDLRSGDPVQADLLFEAIESDPPPSWLQTNRFKIAPYLGRVNLISILPSIIALVSFGWACGTSILRMLTCRLDYMTLIVILIVAMIIATLTGYLWFLIQYPSLDGDTIKATYILQIFPLIALLIGWYGFHRDRDHPWVYPLGMSIFLLTFIHNLGAVISRYLT